MNSRLGVIIGGTLLVLGILAALIYMSIGYHQYEVELCITFKGRSNCGTAAGATRDEALAAAARVACATISSGVGETIACDRTEPDSVRWVRE